MCSHMHTYTNRLFTLGGVHPFQRAYTTPSNLSLSRFFPSLSGTLKCTNNTLSESVPGYQGSTLTLSRFSRDAKQNWFSGTKWNFFMNACKLNYCVANDKHNKALTTAALVLSCCHHHGLTSELYTFWKTMYKHTLLLFKPERME